MLGSLVKTRLKTKITTMHEYQLTSSFLQVSVLFFLLERAGEASSAVRLVPLCEASRGEGTSWNKPAFAGSSTKRFSSKLRFFSSSGTEEFVYVLPLKH